MKFLFLIFITVIFFFGCKDKMEEHQEKYLRWVGDIPFDDQIDDPDFEVCFGDENVFQYFNLGQGMQYKGEKPAIIKEFIEKYQPVSSTQSGWIRVRFIVNCNGEAGRYRMIESDENFHERPFDKDISNQIFEITKNLNGWKVLNMDDKLVDYYQYLVFKINNGQIEKIMP